MISCVAVALIIIAGFIVVVENPIEARDENDQEDTNALYYEHVQEDTGTAVEEERTKESYSEEEIEDTIVEALELDERPTFESEEDVIEWFEELDDEEIEEIYEYQLEQMPDSNGCGLTSYDGGPNERTEDVEHQPPPPIHPNSGGAIQPDASCPYDFPDDHDTVQDCADAYLGYTLDYCRDCCFTPWMECGVGDGDDFDFKEFWSCLYPTRASWDSLMMWASHLTCGLAIKSGIAAASGTGGIAIPIAVAKISAGCAGTAGGIGHCINQVT